MPKTILTHRLSAAVSPINDTDIVIFVTDTKLLSDMVIFNTSTRKCEKVAADGGNSKLFSIYGNHCAQTGNNKVVVFVRDKDCNPVLVTWIKGVSTVTIRDRFGS